MHKQLFTIATISLIVFLTCLNLASAQIERPGPCPKVNVMKDFDIKKYSGTWVLIKGYTGVIAPNFRCLRSTYVYQNPTQMTMAYDWIDSQGKNNGTKGTGTIVGPGRIDVNIKFFAFGDRFSDYLIKTDYKNYAVVFTCDPTDRGTHIMLLNTLTRSYTPSKALLEKAEKIMVSQGLSIAELKLRNVSNCPPLN